MSALDSTQTRASTFERPGDLGAPSQTVSILVLVWSREEGDRLGEVVWLGPGCSLGPWTLGRGEGPEALVLARPFFEPCPRFRPTGALRDPRISRRHLRIERDAWGCIRVENLGRRPMTVAGEAASSVRLKDGDLLEIEGCASLLYRHFEAPTPHVGPRPPPRPFGGADEMGLVGESAAMGALRQRIHFAASMDQHVLVRGPSGAGKEAVARALHQASPRRDGPFVSRNAATLPEGLVDAELFGHSANYPNPGTPARPGLVGSAGGGSLFLDEIAELPEALQVRLLRVLDAGEYTPLGNAHPRRADLRLIAATNRPLSFLKGDLRARFETCLEVPGLGARREDLPLLIVHHLRRLAARHLPMVRRFFPEGDPDRAPRLAQRTLRALIRWPYATHYRELAGLLLQCIEESPGEMLLPARALFGLPAPSLEPEGGPPPPPMAPARPQPSVAPGVLSGAQGRRLDLLRRAGFSPTRAGASPDYPGGRQAAARHLNVLLAVGLRRGGWRAGPAIALLLGSDEAGRACLERRLDRLLRQLRAAYPSPPDARALAALRRSYGQDDVHILRLIEALEQGALV